MEIYGKLSVAAPMGMLFIIWVFGFVALDKLEEPSTRFWYGLGFIVAGGLLMLLVTTNPVIEMAMGKDGSAFLTEVIYFSLVVLGVKLMSTYIASKLPQKFLYVAGISLFLAGFVSIIIAFGYGVTPANSPVLKGASYFVLNLAVTMFGKRFEKPLTQTPGSAKSA